MFFITFLGALILFLLLFQLGHLCFTWSKHCLHSNPALWMDSTVATSRAAWIPMTCFSSSVFLTLVQCCTKDIIHTTAEIEIICLVINMFNLWTATDSTWFWNDSHNNLNNFCSSSFRYLSYSPDRPQFYEMHLCHLFLAFELHSIAPFIHSSLFILIAALGKYFK